MSTSKPTTQPKDASEFAKYFNSQDHLAVDNIEEYIDDETGEIARNFENELDYQLLFTLVENRNFRKKYTPKIWRFTIIWTTFIGVIVLFNALNLPWVNGYNSKFNLSLSDSVLITLITTATVNAFGFFILVLKFMYSADHLKRTPKK